MLPEQEFELLKEHWIDTSIAHMEVLLKLKYDQLSELGVKGLIAKKNYENIVAYTKLLKAIHGIKVDSKKDKTFLKSNSD